VSKTSPAMSYSEFCQEMSRERVRHYRKLDNLEARLKAFQATCKHENTRFQEDPSGGNDSCLICILCDKVVK
jgi:hypothetical protein